jgi:hypothetical protein
MPARPVAVVMPGSTVQLAARAVQQGVVNGDQQRRPRRRQQRHHQGHDDQPNLIGRPARSREEPVGQIMVAAAGQPGPGQHPGDRAHPGLGEEPDQQGLEGREGPDREAGCERGQ